MNPKQIKIFLAIGGFFLSIGLAAFFGPSTVFASTGFTITTPTAAIAAGTPSRAITLTVTGGSVGASTASFALSDNSAGGTFYPSSPVTIPANSVSGTTTQFVYIPSPSAPGAVTITATATGGIAATQTLTLPIGTATKFVNDNFSGTSGTDLITHTPTLGSTWTRPWPSSSFITKLLNGSGGVYDSGTGHLSSDFIIPTAPAATEHDVSVTISNINNTTTVSGVSTFIANSNTLQGYRFVTTGGAYYLIKYVAGTGTNFFSGYGSVTNGSTHTMTIAVRTINGLQYVFALSDGALVDTPFQDSALTSGYPGFIAEIPSGKTPASTDSVASNFVGSNVNWTPNISVSPGFVASNNSGNITLTLTGTNTNWVSGTTVFSLSGVANVTKVSQSITSTTSATVVITTGAGTGNLVISDGTYGGVVSVAPGTLTVSPSAYATSSTPTITLTGGGTSWTTATPSPLFSVSGGTGASIGTPTINSNTSATAVLSTGSSTGILTITDNSTGATASFSVSNVNFTVTTPTAAIGAGTPSRAITITTTGGSVGPTTASFALSDGGVGGTFYPSSPVTVPANSVSGTTTQFVYMPAAGASGTITITVTATGGVASIQTLSLPIGVASDFASDTYSGTSGTSLTAHTPNIGSTWVKPFTSGTLNKQLNGSGGAYDVGTGHVSSDFVIPTAAASTEQDVSVTVSNVNNTKTIPDVSAMVPNSSTLQGYRLVMAGGSYVFLKYLSGNGTTIYTSSNTAVTNGSTHTLRLAIRNINGLQYVFPIADGALITTPTQDGSLSSGYAGHIAEIPSGQTPASTDSVFSNFIGSNVDWSSTPQLALSGPSSGVVSTPSTNFTVTGTALSASTTITPSDGGNGGTFSPTSFVLTNASPTGTFTYTPASTGAKTISISNNQSITNPSSLTYTALGTPLTVTFPSSNVYQSPYQWRNSSGAAIIVQAGGYMRFTVSGTTQILANVDTTVNNGLTTNQMPTIKVLVNSPTIDGTYSFVQLPANDTASTQVTLASGLSAGTTYTVLLSMLGPDGTATGCWSGTVCETKINSLQFDNGSAVASSSSNSKVCAFWGDSYLQSYFGGSTSGAEYTFVDYTLSYPGWVSQALGCEYAQIGIGSQGFVQTGNGGYPILGSSWNMFDSSHSRSFASAPDYAFVAEGINDHGQSSATVTTNVTSLLQAMRTSFGSATKIFVVIPINHQQAAAIRAGVAAAHDSKIYIIDLGTNNLNTVFAGAATWASPDGIHLDAIHQSIYAAGVSKQAQQYLDTAASTVINATPVVIPENHSGNITLTLTGNGTNWVSGTTAFAISGVSGVTKVSQSITSTTTATLVLTTGSSTGTLYISDGTNNASVVVAAATLSISPANGSTGTSPVLTLTGTNTVWTQETAAGLFSVSGGSGASIGTPTVNADGYAVATLTAGSATGTLTITDNSTGATATFTVGSGVTTVSFPSANIYESPYQWRNSGGSAILVQSGGYLKFTVTGTTSITANVDTTVNNGVAANSMPTIKVLVNSPTLDGTTSFVQFPSNDTASTAITLASGLTASQTYTVILSMTGGDGTLSGCWSGTVCEYKINSLQFSSGSQVSAPPIASKNCAFWGDSYLQSYFGGSTSGGVYNYVDYTLSYPGWVSQALGCEYAQIGIGSQGFVRGGNGGYPDLGSSWNMFDSSDARSFATPPDYAFISEGTNDHDESSSAVTANVTSLLQSMRSTFGSGTKIFVIIPFDHQQISAIESGVTAAADPNVYIIDTGTAYIHSVFAGAATWLSSDGLHLDAIHHGIWAASVSLQAQAALDTTAPGNPFNLATTPGNGQMQLSWSAPVSNGGSSITNYVVQYRVTGSGSWSVFSHSASSATSITVTGLANNTSYDFEVAAVNTTGTGVFSPVATAATNNELPGAPTGVTAVAGNASASVTFTAPASNGGSAITGYTVISNPSGGTDSNAGSTSLSHLVTGLTNGTAYTFTVTATNSAGTGSASSASNSVTPATVPGVPTALSASLPVDNQVQLSWTAPSANGGAAVTDYSVQYEYTGANNQWSTFAHSASAATTQTVTGLGTGISYTFQVAAVNVAGTGAYSSTITATPTGTSTSSGGGTFSGGTTTPTQPTGPTVPVTPTQPSVPSAPAGTFAGYTPSGSSVSADLINDDGTFYLIVDGTKLGITDPGILASYGFSFSDATPATPSQSALPSGAPLAPNDGALVKTAGDPTVYLIVNQQRVAFTNAAAFLKLGYSFANVLVVTSPELDKLPVTEPIADAAQAHPEGTNIIIGGTVYYDDGAVLHPYTSLAVWNSWNLTDDFSNAVPANAYDLTLPIGSPVIAR